MPDDLKIFILEQNPYRHQRADWFSTIDSEDLIYFSVDAYHSLDAKLDLWERIHAVLEGDTGYMGGPTLWEDTWIKSREELLKVRTVLEHISDSENRDQRSWFQKVFSKRKNALEANEKILIQNILSLTDKAIEREWWLVFDLTPA